jgi:hypothetical protein
MEDLIFQITGQIQPRSECPQSVKRGRGKLSNLNCAAQ